MEAYDRGSFDGNLWELVAPVAFTPDNRSTPLAVKLRTWTSMARPWIARPGSLQAVAGYAAAALKNDYSRERALVYIDNKRLDGFLQGVASRGCSPATCANCDYCREWRERCVTVSESSRREILAAAGKLDTGLLDGSHWK